MRSNDPLSRTNHTKPEAQRSDHMLRFLTSLGVQSVRYSCHLVGTLLLLILLASCRPTSPAQEPVLPSPTTLSSVVTSSPTEPPAPSPTATSTPQPTDTSTPQPTDTSTSTPPPTNTATPQPTPTPEPTVTPMPPTPAITPSAELAREMEALEAETEALRGLQLALPITRSLMTRDGLAAYMDQQLAEEYSPEEVEAEVQVLAVFDFVPEDYDLLGLLSDAYSSEVLGMYDDERDILYIITEAAGGELDLVSRLTTVHEYTHGIQDEHFGLDTFLDGEQLSDDQFLARQSLSEGDATLVMAHYLATHMDELSSKDLEALASRAAEGRQGGLAVAPPIFRETFDFPYVHGVEFVSTLQGEGWEAVNTAFADPPQSSEQILHPEKYLSRDDPQIVALPPLTDTLGAGWRLLRADTLGEFQMGLYLAQRLEPATADLASQGWGGDQYALYVKDGAKVLAFGTAWDSPQDREEFVTAYQAYAGEKYGQAATHVGETEIWWETPAQTAVLTWEETTVWVILGPDRATVETVLSAAR